MRQYPNDYKIGDMVIIKCIPELVYEVTDNTLLLFVEIKSEFGKPILCWPSEIEIHTSQARHDKLKKLGI